MPKSIKTTKQRTSMIIQRLQAEFPHAACALVHDNALQLLIATILSAQCTDERVNIVTAELFAKYKTVHDFADADLIELEQAIRSTGFYRNKAKNIKNCCRQLIEKHNGEVPNTMEDLTALPGVARKTANVVLGNIFHLNLGVVVDTHVKRISKLLGLTTETNPVKIESDLMKLVPREEWTMFSHYLILHGRKTCTARRPKCADCVLNDLCPAVQ